MKPGFITLYSVIFLQMTKKSVCFAYIVSRIQYEEQSFCYRGMENVIFVTIETLYFIQTVKFREEKHL